MHGPTKMLADVLGATSDPYAVEEAYDAVCACPTCALPLRVTLIVCPPQRTWRSGTVHDTSDGHERHAPLDMYAHYDVVCAVRSQWIATTFTPLARGNRATPADADLPAPKLKAAAGEHSARRREKAEAVRAALARRSAARETDG